eukprot:1966926-Amphidinium_carterae.1
MARACGGALTASVCMSCEKLNNIHNGCNNAVIRYLSLQTLRTNEDQEIINVYRRSSVQHYEERERPKDS